jgi:hypothetical protein
MGETTALARAAAGTATPPDRFPSGLGQTGQLIIRERSTVGSVFRFGILFILLILSKSAARG